MWSKVVILFLNKNDNNIFLNENLFSFRFDNYFFRYEHRATLQRHIRHECDKSRGYYCPECNKKFSYGFLVTRHLVKVHKVSISKSQNKMKNNKFMLH